MYNIWENKSVERTFLVNNEMFGDIRELLSLNTENWKVSIFMSMSYSLTVKCIKVQCKM